MKLEDWLKIEGLDFKDRDLRFLIKSLFEIDYPSAWISGIGLGQFEIKLLSGIKQAYSKGIPLAYILGKEDFFGFEFKINRDVLIPRPETELLVEQAVHIINNNGLVDILDLCCGCSNIAISIEKAVKNNLSVFASDISVKALELSLVNITGYKSNVRLVNSDLLTAFKKKSFDLIISNPPYVETENIKDGLVFEPRLALDGGQDGLNIIREILRLGHKYLNKKGYLILEFGCNHKEIVDNFINKMGLYEKIKWIKDYFGHHRGVILRAIS